MHGRVKVRRSEEQARVKREEKERQQKEYSAVTCLLFASRAAGVYDKKTLQKIAIVLEKAPDVLTLWNYRREIILKIIDELSNEEKCAIFQDDLELTSKCLIANPKSYGSWHHRSWIMSNHPQPDWNAELKTCNLALKMDERNFHCWDYRRFIVTKGGISSEKEIEYTDKLLEANFSNYSSWHYRSGLLKPKSSPENELPVSPPPKCSTDFSVLSIPNLSEELDLVHNAVYTDPKDQSPWFYYSWLLGHGERKSYLREIYLSRSLGRLIFVFTSPKMLETLNDLDVELTITIPSIPDVSQEPTVLKHTPNEIGGWKSVLPCNVSAVWWLCISPDTLNFPQLPTASGKGDANVIVPTFLVTVRIPNNGNNSNKEFSTHTVLECRMASDQNESLTRVDLDPLRLLNPAISPVHEPCSLVSELTIVQDLVAMEPENKWALLSLVSLLRFVHPPGSAEKIKSALATLSRIDSQRKRYYNDIASAFAAEDSLDRTYKRHSRCLVLARSNLTRLFSLDWYALMTHLDFSNNLLDSLPDTMAYLVCLKELNLDDNRLPNLKGVEGLPSLLRLTVRRNRLVRFIDIESALHCPCLRLLAIGGNGVADLDDLTDRLASHPNMRSQSHTLSVTYDWKEE